MTTPPGPAPGQPYRPEGYPMGVPPAQRLGPPPRLGGPPQSPPQGPQQDPGQPPHGPVPEPRQAAGPEPLPPRDKGFLGSLLDVNFDYMVTPRVIKAFSLLTLLLITSQCVIFLGIGLWILGWSNGWAWGLMMVIASPLVWLFEALLVRIFMESVIVRFKTAEYLRIIKDKL
jgi:hypothetical protein